MIEDTLELTQKMMTNMKAPDKIYIDDLAVVNDCVTKISTTRLINFSEYIRKDALLEWTKSQKARLKQGYKHDWKNDDTLNGGKLMLDELINKLNSM